MGLSVLYGVNAKNLVEAKRLFESATGIQTEKRENSHVGEYCVAYTSPYGEMIIQENVDIDGLIDGDSGIMEEEFSEYKIILYLLNLEDPRPVQLALESASSVFVFLREEPS